MCSTHKKSTKKTGLKPVLLFTLASRQGANHDNNLVSSETPDNDHSGGSLIAKERV